MQRNILIGINDGHNASVAVIANGELVCAIQEERITREKNKGGFPKYALEWCFKFMNMNSEDVVTVARAGTFPSSPLDRSERAAAYASLDRISNRIKRAAFGIRPIRTASAHLPVSRKRLATFRRGVDPYALSEKVKFFDHHLCHAAAAYYGWGQYDGPTLVLTADGAGDGICATVNIGEHGKLTRLAAIPQAESIGALYSVVTFLMGMVPLEHEYKIMGLAPYADPRLSARMERKFTNMYEFPDSKAMIWKRNKNTPPMYSNLSYFKGLLEYERFDGVAGGLQAFLEGMLSEWVRRCIRLTGIRRVALSGGVFMNVKANKKILDMGEVEELWIFPSCGDETNSIGAAYLAHVEAFGHYDLTPLQNLYLGPAYSFEEIAEVVFKKCKEFSLTYKTLDDPESVAASLLANRRVVARFAGRGEFGARALGNRSILADPSDPAVVRNINEMIKMRDFWMPFACSILSEQSDNYLINPKSMSSPYMIITFDTTVRRHELIAGIHPFDFTIRPQEVSQTVNPAYHRLLRLFEEETGRGGVLNTSFNLHGEPIVNSPADALDVFCRSGLTHLILEDVLIEKNEGAIRDRA